MAQRLRWHARFLPVAVALGGLAILGMRWSSLLFSIAFVLCLFVAAMSCGLICAHAAILGLHRRWGWFATDGAGDLDSRYTGMGALSSLIMAIVWYIVFHGVLIVLIRAHVF